MGEITEFDCGLYNTLSKNPVFPTNDMFKAWHGFLKFKSFNFYLLKLKVILTPANYSNNYQIKLY